jgi:integrase
VQFYSKYVKSVHFCLSLVKKEIMSLKDSNTKCDYLDFDYIVGVVLRLRKNPKQKLIADYITISLNTGLRCSDVLKLTWDDLKKETLFVKEQKTDKKKKIAINEAIHSIIEPDYTGSPFITQKGGVVTIWHLNRMLKKVFEKDVKSGLNISTHTLRKSFGRRVYKNNQETESSLIYLSELFNHSDLRTTRVYLGIRQEELNDIYLNL